MPFYQQKRRTPREPVPLILLSYSHKQVPVLAPTQGKQKDGLLDPPDSFPKPLVQGKRYALRFALALDQLEQPLKGVLSLGVDLLLNLPGVLQLHDQTVIDLVLEIDIILDEVRHGCRVQVYHPCYLMEG